MDDKLVNVVNSEELKKDIANSYTESISASELFGITMEKEKEDDENK